MRIGRNDPCPCGSGKKYKKCCLQDGPTEEDGFARSARDALENLESAMSEFAGEWLGEDFAAAAWEEFTFGGEHLSAEDAEEQLLGPWILYEWRPRTDPEGRTVSEAFLDAYEDTPEVGRNLIELITDEPCSFYDVVETVPGKRIRLHDILRGIERDVVERTASRAVQRGDVLFGRVVPFVGVSLLIGTGTIALPPEWKTRILQLRKALRDDVGEIDAVHLQALSSEMRRTYFEARSHVVEPPTPRLSNTDGDPLEPHTLTYRVPSAEVAFDALRSLAVGVRKADLLSDATFDDAHRLHRVEFPWLKRGNSKNASWDNTVLGHLRIEGTRLSVEVNSAKRAARIRKQIEKRLGENAGEPSVSVKSAEALLREARAGGDGPAARRADAAKTYRNPELREAHRQLMEKHWEGWMSRKLPALGGMTPLEAMNDPDGREMVEALLMEAERLEQRRPPYQPRYDVNRVRERLGLPVHGKVVPIEPDDR